MEIKRYNPSFYLAWWCMPPILVQTIEARDFRVVLV